MEYLIGGYSYNPKIIIEQAIDFFENLFSKSLYFEGFSENKYFMGIIKEKVKKAKENAVFFNDKKLFKSLYYSEIPEVLKKIQSSVNTVNLINSLKNDFIYAEYEDNKGIKVYIDKFAREKIYFLKTPPYLFCTSLKFLISILDKKRINYIALSRFLNTGVIIGKETIFSNINRLDIGEFLHINKNGAQVNNYWNISKEFFEIANHDVKDIPYWIDNIYNSLKETVDFPVKEPILSMMSGGLDSTVITSILLKEFDVPVEALTIVAPNYNEEEGYKASEIAEYLNIPHTIRVTKLENYKKLDEFYSQTFNIAEEPMGGTAFFSRYFAFTEIEKMNKHNIMTGDGAGEIFSYVRDFVIKNLKYINYMYYTPLKLRKSLMKLMHKLYYPSFKLMGFVKNKNILNSLEILMNSDFLESTSQLQSFFLSWQFSNLEDSFHITGHKVELDSFLAAIWKNVKSYPLRGYNQLGYQFMMNSINSDALITHNLSSFFDFKLYCPYISDIAFKKILPIPSYIKTTGDRGKWIVREMAKQKKLLPANYFDWKPKYGLRQLFFEEDSFSFVKTYILNIIDSLKPKTLLNLRPFKKFFNNTTLKRITIHSSEYMKFNIWFGFLGWLASI